jgi:high-affinity Fe2+/Pb2+ permease
MNTAVSFAHVPASKTSQDSVPLVALASAVVTAAAGGLLGFSLLPGRKRRLSTTSQAGLGVLLACAGVVLWVARHEEAAAARNLLAYIDEKRDARWLRRNPIDFG